MITQEDVVYINAKLIAIAHDLDLVEPGYEAKVYWNTSKATKYLTQICIYIGKQKCIKLKPFVPSSMTGDDILDHAKTTLESFAESNKRNDAIDVIRYALETCKNIKENDIMAKKSAQEIEFEQFEAQKRADADSEIAEFKAGIDKEIEDKRQELLNNQRKSEAQKEADGYWYFYSGLLNAGFNEEQALQILLTKK